MNFLYWIMLMGIGLSILKLLIVMIFLFIKIEKFNITWHKLDKKLLVWVISAFAFEVTIAVLVNFEIHQAYLINKDIGDILVKLLTSAVSIGWMSFYGYTFFKLFIKISIMSSDN